MEHTANHARRWIYSIFVALGIWGIYLAVGATGLFSRQANRIDVRRLLVVLGCSVGFLMLWYFSLRSRELRRSGSRELDTIYMNPANALSLGSAIFAHGLWWTAYEWETISARLGLSSVLCFGISTVATLIGLSDPQSRRGKWLSVVGLALDLLAVVIFVARVWIHTHRIAS